MTLGTPQLAGEIAGGAVASLACPITNPVPAGSAVVLSVSSGTLTVTINGTVQDSRGNTYAVVQSVATNAAIWQLIALNVIALSPGDSITIPFSSASGPKQAVAVYVTGVATASAVDQLATANGATGSPSVSSPPLSQPVEAVIATLGSLSAGGLPVPVANAAMRLVGVAQNNGPYLTVLQAKTVIPSSVVTGTMTTSSTAWGALLLSLIPAPATTSREIVRTGIAQFFGGSTYDAEARAYRGSGPLIGYGLSTVRAYQPKRMDDVDYVKGQAAGRGMGAAMLVEIPNDTEHRDAKPAITGRKHILYTVNLHGFHLAYQPYAEDAQQDAELLVEAIKSQLRSDITLGGICYQAGESRAGLKSRLYPSSEYEEMTATAFTITFEAEVEIVA